MKKLGLLIAASALCVSATAFAGHSDYYNNGGVPQGFGNNLNTVAAVEKDSYDDQVVTLTGRLVNYLGHERYEFADNTGVIEVELDDDRDWSYISKDEPIQLTGKVDRDFLSTTIEAYRIVPLRNMQNAPVPAPVPAPAAPAQY